MDIKYLGQWILHNKCIEQDIKFPFNLVREYRFRDLNFTFLEESLKVLIAKNDILRSEFTVENQKLTLNILPKEACEVVVEKIDLRKSVNWKSELNRLIALESEQGFNLERWPLFSCSVFLTPNRNSKFVLLLVMHHTLTDFVSSELIYQNLLAYYNAFEKGAPIDQTESQSIRDYFHWKEGLREKYLLKAEKYWLNQIPAIEDKLPILHTPHEWRKNGYGVNGKDFELRIRDYVLNDKDLFIQDQAMPDPRLERGASYFLVVKNRLFRQLKSFVGSSNITLFSLVLGCINAVLCHENNVQSNIIAFPVSDRDQSDMHKMIGWLVTTSYYNYEIKPNLSLLDYIRFINSSIFASMNLRFCNFCNILFEHGITESYDTYIPLFVNFVNNTSKARMSLWASSGFDKKNELIIPHHNLNCTIVEFTNGLKLNLGYRKSVYTSAQIESISKKVNSLFTTIVNNSSMLVKDIEWP